MRDDRHGRMAMMQERQAAKGGVADTFKAIAIDRVGNKFRCTLSCPDQWAGTIDLSGRLTWFGDHERQPVRASPHPRLILILESPHQSEFKEDGNPIGPAIGKTGESIRDHLHSAITKAAHRSGRSLVLVNAIQYQCSLGAPTHEHRDDVFQQIWQSTDAEELFRRRLRSYLRAGDTVVNCCTKRNRELIHAAIVNVSSEFGITPLRRCHPSSVPWWKSGKEWAWKR
jgi:hypothetical protein